MRPTPTARSGGRHAAAELELFTHRFAAIAAEMGEMLRRSALSTNVRDRLDYSCGLLDAGGSLVVNAPHIPVHLGALGLCVRRTDESFAASGRPLRAGDVAITNHPAFGGSHLPDVTLISPVFAADGVRIGAVASRAHHAEIGGKRPGSMPPDARCLEEEGVVIAPRLLAEAGRSRLPEIAELLRHGPFPSRAPAENLADLEAALAANRAGVAALEALAARHGRERVQHFMARQKEDAARRLEAALGRLPLGERTAEERLDDGYRIRVRARVYERDGRRLELDFAGTSDVHPGNLNATPAIVRSAVLYVLRLLLAEDLPLNEGLLDRVELKLPVSFLAPEFPADPRLSPAVVGGNTETSQRLVDTLIKAFGLLACGQGTMNNLLFGDATFGYYETLCGGAGAGAGFDGASAVHTHMTNTRVTDPEILELRYPVRLERFAIRRGSGGAGRFRGGDGVVRELRFLRPLELSILSQHRVERPFGLEGGEPGARGRQVLHRAAGGAEELPGTAQASVGKGDRLVLETPGGGGWGEAEESRPEESWR